MRGLSNTFPDLNADETLAFLEAHDAQLGAKLQKALHDLRYLSNAVKKPAAFGPVSVEEFAKAVDALNAARAERWELLQEARAASGRISEAYESRLDGPESEDVRKVVLAFDRILGGGSR